MSDLAAAITDGDRRALARAITLAESTRPDDRERAIAVIEAVLPERREAMRIAVSGPPGAGKSTLIEALGVRLADGGTRLGVLTVDPTSARSGGSVLGDKTRMEELSRRENAFIRPSPSSGALGGVAPRTREAMILVEAWGAEVVLLETVGVGQSEFAAVEMVDQLLVLVNPGGGDELQGVKRGLMEMADVLAVNKADGELSAAAERARSEHAAAAHLMRPRHAGMPTPVLAVSALEATGLDELWAAIVERHRTLEDDGRLAAQRAEQRREWLRSEVRDGLFAAVDADARASALASRAEADAAEGVRFPPRAAREIVEALLEGRG